MKTVDLHKIIKEIQHHDYVMKERHKTCSDGKTMAYLRGRLDSSSFILNLVNSLTENIDENK
jgi:hypothetical protein